jgi:hypothetical protein
VEILAIIGPAFGEHIMRGTRVLERNCPNSPTAKKAKQLKSKVKSMMVIFFGIKRTVHEEFVLTWQTASSTFAVTFIGDFISNFD